MSNDSLLDRTLDLLRNRGDLTYQEIADGADVDREWLAKLAQGRIPNPGVNGVENVYKFLRPKVRRSRASA